MIQMQSLMVSTLLDFIPQNQKEFLILWMHPDIKKSNRLISAFANKNKQLVVELRRLK